MEWCYIKRTQELAKIIEKKVLWGEELYRLWLPDADKTIQVNYSEIESIEKPNPFSTDHIRYVAAAARIADALTQDVLLAPIESSVIPLPHQIRALSRAITDNRVRYLLADEVGLGKTIEAGLILRELKLRGLIKRVLVVAPKGLVTQWVSEMHVHFGEKFRLILPDDLKVLKRIVPAVTSGPGESSGAEQTGHFDNAWRAFAQVVVPMDSVKPLDRRQGWTSEQVDEYNQERYENLISAGWDLIIIDEAHRLGGSTDQVARYKLGQGLSEAAPYLLLLSATPHQGKTDAFHRILSLIDPREFPDTKSISRDRVKPYVIRTEKRNAIDAEGKPLFKSRSTQLVPVCWGERHRGQRFLYEEITKYVREGYNQAIKEKRNYIGFLMILMQRLVVSSTCAICATLERRLNVLAEPEIDSGSLSPFSEDELGDLDGQEQIETIGSAHFSALKNERTEVESLLEIAARCEHSGPDAKAEALLDWIYRFQAEESDPELKILIFTEFIPTQEMLYTFLVERGFSVVCLNGSMEMEERKQVQNEFAGNARILISTDAGGEGLNLQFCHIVINYDIPWNPMRLEQRIGRVDRIGQTNIVRAINLVFEDSVEYRVRRVLEQKLAVIFNEFGIDKTGDVLDSAQAGRMFDEMHIKAILDPSHIEDSVNSTVGQLRELAQETRISSTFIDDLDVLDPGEAQNILMHPLPHWVEQMVINYLKAHGGHVEKNTAGWDLTWPDGEIYKNVAFSSKEAEKSPVLRSLSLEDSKIRELVMQIPRFVSGQPIPNISLSGISREIEGLWSVWRISIASTELNRYKIMPLFLSKTGKYLAPTARHIWDLLMSQSFPIRSVGDSELSSEALYRLQKVAEEYGRPIYEELLLKHKALLFEEQRKMEHSFAARRRSIERIGLPQVREHRLKILFRDEYSSMNQLEQRGLAHPELTPLIVMGVEGLGNE
jgi:SNF2 family DNA or RNA helicase